MQQKICGIYSITNVLDNKRYIGSSKSIYHRWRYSHLSNLKKGIHGNTYLQNAWSHCSENNFKLEILEECDIDQLIIKESSWIEYHNSWNRDFGYNIIRIKDEPKYFGFANGSKNYAEYDDQIVELFNKNISKNSIAVQLGVTRWAVYCCLERHKLHTRNNKKWIGLKLTDDKIQEINQLRQNGLSWIAISKISGISKTQLFRTGIAKDGIYGGTKKRDTYITMTPELKEKAILMRSQGVAWRVIGETLGVDRSLFYRHGLAEKQRHMVRKPKRI